MGYDHYTLVDKLEQINGADVDYNASGDSWTITVRFDRDIKSQVLAAVSQADEIQYDETNSDAPVEWVIQPEGFTR